MVHVFIYVEIHIQCIMNYSLGSACDEDVKRIEGRWVLWIIEVYSFTHSARNGGKIAP
jgi:hypothetical protein